MRWVPTEGGPRASDLSTLQWSLSGREVQKRGRVSRSQILAVSSAAAAAAAAAAADCLVSWPVSGFGILLLARVQYTYFHSD